MKATGGRAASRERRAMLVQGKTGLPPAAERMRTGEREAAIVPAAAPMAPPAPAAVTPAPAGGGKASMPWTRARITGTLFSSDDPNADTNAGSRVTGDAPMNVPRVTGTQRGAERHITGTTYYRAGGEDAMKGSGLERAAGGFSVRPPQRESQLRADAAAVRQPSAERRITGTFARGEGKITGNQEFHFSPRAADKGARTKVTGEGRVEGPKITGSAWTENPKVTGTEDYIAAERNPSERAGQPHGFASAGKFKGKGNHAEPTHHVTGMVGWSPKAAARVTVSGGGRG